MKRNVTVSMNEDTARWVRVEAAKRDMSVSRYLEELLEERRRRVEGYDSARARYASREARPLRGSVPGGAPARTPPDRPDPASRDGGSAEPFADAE